MKPLITICIANYNSADFIKLNLHAFKALIGNQYKVIIRDNGSTMPDYKTLQDVVAQYNNVTLYRVDTTSRGSMAHGEALNELVAKIDTEYGVIMDADAVFLEKGWDKILIEKMSEHMPIYGTQADPGKPQDFPLMYGVLFKTDIMKRMNIDFRPTDPTKMLDTGWRMREDYVKNGYSGGVIYGFNTRMHKQGPFTDIVCTEYYLSEDGEGHIFASHFGRGSAPKAKKLVLITGNTLLVRAVNKILSYANVYKWKMDKNRWISVCNTIINSQ